MNIQQKIETDSLHSAVVFYLQRVQGGKLGSPDLELLQACGILHAWLETVAKLKYDNPHPSPETESW